MSRYPVIGIFLGVTTRGLNVSDFDELALFQTLLPSVVQTAEVGFIYRLYVGFDRGDAFFDNKEVWRRTQQWFKLHISSQLEYKSIKAELRLVRVDNPDRKPGPVLNLIAAQMKTEGVDYYYRINDDSVLKSNWAHKMVNKLLSLGPSSAPVGVVGPACDQGNTWILTHDFVHKSHLDIFPTYYPAVFKDWYLDNWISLVYGRSRTYRLFSARVEHRIGAHSTRYEYVPEVVKHMGDELIKGRKLVRKYLKKKKLRSILSDYDADPAIFHIHSD